MTTTHQERECTEGQWGAAVPIGAANHDLRDPRYQAFWLLRIGYTAIPLTMGIDKFFNGLVYWPKYLADWINNILPGYCATE